jgi:uncharacterized membrane protein
VSPLRADRNPWALLALLLAAPALVLGLVPGVGFLIGVPGGALAALLALAGLARSERTGTGRRVATVGLVLGLLAMFISYSTALLLAGLR